MKFSIKTFNLLSSLSNHKQALQNSEAVYMTAELMFSMVLVAWNISATVSWESHYSNSMLEHTSQQLLKTETTALKETKLYNVTQDPENALEEVSAEIMILLTLK